MEDLIKAQSEICKTFSNPHRLKITNFSANEQALHRL